MFKKLWREILNVLVGIAAISVVILIALSPFILWATLIISAVLLVKWVWYW